ncbi:MAG: hypothetical protein ACXAD7_01560 [Candidatus Kariarchaeaceae archaeon]|jgi:DNA-binding transcriptional ArsR family regulator
MADAIEDPLINPTTLRIFLYVRSHTNNEIGVRETQRALNLNSPSTASWHLEKLQSAGLIDKLQSNRFILNENGKSYDEFNIPMTVTVRYVKGLLFPKFFIFFAFIIFDIIFTIILWIAIDDPVIIAINGIISLLLSLGILIYFWILFNQQISNFNG